MTAPRESHPRQVQAVVDWLGRMGYTKALSSTDIYALLDVLNASGSEKPAPSHDGEGFSEDALDAIQRGFVGEPARAFEFLRKSLAAAKEGWEFECKMGDRLCTLANVERTEGGNLNPGKIAAALREQGKTARDVPPHRSGGARGPFALSENTRIADLEEALAGMICTGKLNGAYMDDETLAWAQSILKGKQRTPMEVIRTITRRAERDGERG